MKPLELKYLFFVFLFLSPCGYAFSNNLKLSDFYGTWAARSTIVTGEKQSLVINDDKSVAFSREFTNYPTQSFKIKGNNFYLTEDILILDFHENEHGSAYKLVLSGWKSDTTKKLYGTLYMYEHGKQFNGISVSFDPVNMPMK